MEKNVLESIECKPITFTKSYLFLKEKESAFAIPHSFMGFHYFELVLE